MNFGVLTHRETSPNAAIPRSIEPKNYKANGSGNLKDKRSELAEDSWRVTKMPRPFPVEIPSKKTENFIAFGRSNIWPSVGDEGQNMLSFSSLEPHCKNENFSRTRGVLNEGMLGPFARLKGPFSPLQWTELERQALIYKHIVANVSIPSNLLVPLSSPLNPYASSGSGSSNFLGWGPFHLGFSSGNDPEPGRCRRTDGKKWRCSRDAVPDQKYCERHINRGRHRSRKPVEGQTGHDVSESTTTSVAPIASSSSAAMVMSSSSTSNSQGAKQHKPNFLQHDNVDLINSRKQGFQDLSLIPPTINLNSKEVSFSIQKQHFPFEESSNSEFGIVCSDALVNPSQTISYLNTKDSGSLLGFNDQEANDQCHDCPKDQSDLAPVSWPEQLKSDWTQLSMSIPVAPSDFSSSSYPSLREKPVSWGNSTGGPLGEVLASTSISVAAGTNLSSLKAYESSPQLDSTPNGVLQKSTFVSLSNSSSGSSHIADNRSAPREC